MLSLRGFLKTERRPSWTTGVYLQDTLQVPPPGLPIALLTSGAALRHPGTPHTRADPFLFEQCGRIFLFVEAQTLDDPGQIEAYEITSGGPEKVGTVLVEPFHVSYPCVFRIGADIYMLPETAASGKMRLYRFDDFPKGLKHQRDLLLGWYTDPSPILIDGVWYIFCTSDQGLLIFYTTDLIRGELRPHPCNPITADPRYRRSAGVPFFYEGELIRPAQDCTRRHGENVNLLRIEVLSQTEYRETPRRENILAREHWWNARGGHHVSVCPYPGGIAVAVDGQAIDSLINKLAARVWMRLFRTRSSS